MVINTNSETETKAIGEKIGSFLKGSTVICLEGTLGAGKTLFTKGLAIGLKVADVVTSPTFTIMKAYNGRLPLYHIDLYRLDGKYYDYDLDDYIYGEGVTVIEWSDKFDIDCDIKIIISGCDNNRKLELTFGSKYKELETKL